MNSMFVIHAERILTPSSPGPVRGNNMMKISEFFDSDIVIEDGVIADIRKHKSADVKANLVTPGLFDAHTHIPFVGSRSKEFYMRSRGKTYMEILQAGGGIHYTSSLVKNASLEVLVEISKDFVRKFTEHGVVGIECKSGYGLDKENEIKQLKAIKLLRDVVPNKLSGTFLGLHARPKNIPIDEYIDEMKALLKYIKENSLAESVDAFCDKDVFLPDEIEDFLLYAKSVGLKIRLHADEIENVGATKLGVKVGAVSVDHVLKIGSEDIYVLSNSDTVATLMPSTSFYLGESYAPARDLISAGAGIALGSDFNPGSSPIYMPSFVMHLAIRFLRMEPEEVLNAYTVNSAYVVGYKSGLIAPNYPADLVIWKTSEFLDIPYMWQENFVEHVLINGRMVA
ncbi:MAG: imidazolonepropionase [Fervidobacterium sp.]|uniref:Imidazolonepropionase n=1 Tax=Fervidobacterium gondwanense DSM 13020 TaxID=1121883 RepID=A0A1M7RVC6_FERGO|nr:imidazolonepropionase [Fervidobacterium gondwanense]SHN49962.1 imidazolonepropionase [Fervidobacterium gondwanense DSM 13020]